MARRLPKDMAWTDVVLEVENPWCSTCGSRMHVRSNRHRYLFSFQGPLHLICKLMQCTDPACPNRHRTFGSERELRCGYAILDDRLGCFLLAGSSTLRSALVGAATSA